MARSKNPNIVLPDAVFEYTPEQAMEMVRCATDPVYFIKKFIKVVHPMQGVVPLELYDYQVDMINKMHTGQDVIILSARQTGKSTVSCAYILWYICFNEHKHVHIVSNKNSGAMEMISRIQFMYEYLPNWLKPGIDISNWNKHALGFGNGSIIESEATTEQSGRGKSVALLYADEFAFVNPSVAEEFWGSISPTLATGGRAIISSTPNGDTNLFATMWRGAELGSNGFTPIYVPWNAPPGRDEEFKQKQIGKIGLLRWTQEYECIFVSSDPLLIDSIMLNEYKRDKIDKNQPHPDARGFVFFETLRRGQVYLVGIDPSTGSGSDFSVIEVFSYPELDQVAEFRSNTTSSPLLYATLKYMLKTMEKAGITTAYMSIENNGVGEGMLTAYQLDETLPEVGDLISEKGAKRLGMTTTGKSKSRACINLKQMFELGRLHIRSMVLITEMQNYIRTGGSYAARKGSTDDCVAALLIILRLIEELLQYDDSAFDLLYGAKGTADHILFNEFGEMESIEPEAMLINDPRDWRAPAHYQSKGGFHDPNDLNSWDPFYGSELFD